MAKKRANGEGSIRKRSDGRWEGRYTAGRDPETGKPIYKNVLGKTQAEVDVYKRQSFFSVFTERPDVSLSAFPSAIFNSSPHSKIFASILQKAGFW